MALLDKLRGTPYGDLDNPAYVKLPVHQFWAALTEFAAGEVTKPQIVAFFNLDAADEADLDWLIGKYQAAANNKKEIFLHRIHDIFVLAEYDFPGYQTEAELQGMIDRI